ncbi:MAG: DsbA family protein [Gammaproteobacteria bacterium]|nr:DsbA family protein [Gammaproteobacteria bacterium]
MCFLRLGLSVRALWTALLLLAVPPLAAEPPTAPAAQDTAAAERAEREALLALVRRDRGPAKDESVVLDVTGQPSVGNEQAPVVLLEFTDFQCPFCRRHLNSVLPKLLEEYVNCGKVRYVFFDFPSETKHPNAFSAALAARCASDQRRYWDVHNWLFANSQLLDRERLLAHANAVGLDVAAFRACIDSGRHAEAVRSNMGRGVQLRVRGTPTFFLGRKGEKPGEVVVLRRITGAQPLELFQKEVDFQLAEAASKPAPAAQVACCEPAPADAPRQ